MTYRDDAAAELLWRQNQDAADAEAARQALIDAAKQALVPMFTNHDGVLVLDPMTGTSDLVVNQKTRLVVLNTKDGSAVSFAVFPDANEVHVAKFVDGQWQKGPQVFDMDDVGFALSRGY